MHLKLLAAGDTIVMMKGTHSGSNNRGINGNGNKKFVIMGDPDYSCRSNHYRCWWQGIVTSRLIIMRIQLIRLLE